MTNTATKLNDLLGIRDKEGAKALILEFLSGNDQEMAIAGDSISLYTNAMNALDQEYRQIIRDSVKQLEYLKDREQDLNYSI